MMAARQAIASQEAWPVVRSQHRQATSTSVTGFTPPTTSSSSPATHHQATPHQPPPPLAHQSVHLVKKQAHTSLRVPSPMGYTLRPPSASTDTTAVGDHANPRHTTSELGSRLDRAAREGISGGGGGFSVARKAGGQAIRTRGREGR